MILEGIVTTVSEQGEVNIAPMGPQVGPGMERFVLRPFRMSQTFRNLKARSEGVLHVTDDVLLLARAALGAIAPLPSLFPAKTVHGWVLQDACRYYEFQIDSLDDREERCRLEAVVRHAGRIRDFFGFNRAKHAVVEAAILATRTDFLPLDQIDTEYAKLRVLVEKTGGPQEKEAFDFLCGHLADVKRAQSAGPSLFSSSPV
jgi:hypothetical protein